NGPSGKARTAPARSAPQKGGGGRRRTAGAVAGGRGRTRLPGPRNGERGGASPSRDSAGASRTAASANHASRTRWAAHTHRRNSAPARWIRSNSGRFAPPGKISGKAHRRFAGPLRNQGGHL